MQWAYLYLYLLSMIQVLLKSYLAEKGVLSVELVLSVLSRPPGVEVFLAELEPNPMGLRLF